MNRNGRVEEISLLLTRNNKLSFADAQALRKAFGSTEDVTFEDFILEQGVVDKSDLLQALGQYYKVTAIDVIGEFFDHYLLHLFPKDVLLLHYFIPYYREGDLLTVIAANPSDPHLPVVISKYISHNINFMVGLAQDIHESIEEFYDESDTYQPNDIAAQRMERSAQEVHPSVGEHIVRDNPNERIPIIDEETIDDYESR